MADAAANSGVTLPQLTDANACLTSATTKQYNTITRLLGDLRLRSTSPSTGNAARNQTIPSQQTCTIKTLQAAVKNCWAVGGFCSTHGWGVGLNHTSGSCKNKGSVHVEAATCDKPAGPGASKSKVWDDFA